MITKKGYRRIYDPVSRRLRMEHDLVWERAYGPIPVGFSVHHINHDKLDNRLENLELLDPLTHKRHHGGCELRAGLWWKPCRKCRVMKPITEYYVCLDGVLSWCRACQIANAVLNKRRRRARERQWPVLAQQLGKEATLEGAGNTLGELAAKRSPATA